ncbi:MAG: hypothetical protein R3E83_11245 [Burkholderiaceae bacterium]
MRPNIVFGIQSAIHRPETLAQLVDALAGYPVLIHHDFGQQADLRINRPNAFFVPEPEATGWSGWGTMRAITKTVRHAIEHLNCDYFQLLTPVDLPLRPLSEFEAYISADAHDVAVDHVFLDADPIAFMCFAYRAWAPEGSALYRLQWLLHEAYFEPGYATVNRHGLSFPERAREARGGGLAWRARAAEWLTGRLFDFSARAHPGALRAAAGGTWFGANRRGCEALLRAADDPAQCARFQSIFSPDELMVPTVLANAGLRVAPGNLWVSPFEGARPRWLGMDDLPTLRASGRYFARKFPDDPQAPVRVALLAQLAGNAPENGPPERVAQADRAGQGKSPDQPGQAAGS